MELARAAPLLLITWQAALAASPSCAGAPGAACDTEGGDAVGLLQASYLAKDSAKLQTNTDTSHWRIQAHPFTKTVVEHCQSDLAQLCPQISAKSKDFYGKVACLEKNREQLSDGCFRSAFNFTSTEPNPELVSFSHAMPPMMGPLQNIILQRMLAVRTPLFYSDPYNTPTDAKVWFTLVQCPVQPAPKGLLFIHNGGPLPSIFVGDYGLTQEILQKYDIVSVDQRGMGLSALDLIYGVDATKFTSAELNAILDGSRKWEGELSKPQTIPGLQETLTPKCADLRQTHEFNEPADYGNASQVREYLDKKMEFATRCLALYQRDGGDGRTYNPLQYVGTGALVHDMEWFRLAVGAPSISILGFSYGTRVAAAYSAAFPHRLQRVAVTGVMAPLPDLLEYATAATLNVGHILGFLQSECVASGPSCSRNPLSAEDAEKPEYAYTGDINSAIDDLFARSSHGGIWYNEACGEGHSVSTHRLSGFLSLGLAGLHSDSPLPFAAGFQNATWPIWNTILPALIFLVLQNPCSWARHLSKPRSGWDRVAIFDLIPALDMTGRWAKEQTLEVMARTASDPTFGPGSNMFLLYANAMYGWRTLPMPIGFSNADVPVLIAQGLYDDRTGMNMAQKYKENFGNSVMVTAIGGGHCVLGDRHLEAYHILTEFLATGTRPNDGTITGAAPVMPIDFETGGRLVKQHLGGGKFQELM